MFGPLCDTSRSTLQPEEGASHGQGSKDLKPWLKEQWGIPPEANAEFVCAMEDTLEVSQRPYDAQRPLVCFDEGTKPLGKDIRTPLPAGGSVSTRLCYTVTVLRGHT